MSELDVYQLLDAMKVNYKVIIHGHVVTIDELKNKNIKGFEYVVKNLFVRDDKKRNYYLIVIKHDKTINIKELQKQLQSRRLSFASQEDLHRYLKLEAGAVTPLGILNDSECFVNVVFDEEISQYIGVHPLRNDKTLFMKTEELIKIIKKHGNNFQSIHIE